MGDDTPVPTLAYRDGSVLAWIEMLGPLLQNLPSANQVWRQGQAYLEAGDLERQVLCDKLNHLLHNSYLPSRVKVGPGTVFAYGGIGLIIHPDCDIGAGVTVGSQVTLGGGGRRYRKGDDGSNIHVPKILDHAYLSTGCKVLGGVVVGRLAIVGANAVVLNDLPDLSVAVGSPARIITRITPSSCGDYRGFFPKLRPLPQEEFAEYVATIMADTAASPLVSS